MKRKLVALFQSTPDSIFHPYEVRVYDDGYAENVLSNGRKFPFMSDIRNLWVWAVDPTEPLVEVKA